METFDVGCAIIHKGKELLIAQRHLDDSFGGYWEFPGGKREEGETIEACLAREVREELDVIVRPHRLLSYKEVHASGKKLILHFYFCEWLEGSPRAVDCKDFRWVSRETLGGFQFLPGDLEVLEDLGRRWDEYFKS